MPSSSSIVLDSQAVLAFFRRQAGEATVAKLFTGATQGEIVLGMSVVNWGESWYVLARAYGEKLANEKLALLEQIGLQKVAVDWGTARQAAFYKKFGNIAYADCFAAALAKQWDAPLVTGDREFKSLEAEAGSPALSSRTEAKRARTWRPGFMKSKLPTISMTMKATMRARAKKTPRRVSRVFFMG